MTRVLSAGQFFTSSGSISGGTFITSASAVSSLLSVCLLFRALPADQREPEELYLSIGYLEGDLLYDLLESAPIVALGDPSVSRHAVRINAKDHLPRIDSFQTKNKEREMQYSSFVQVEPGMSSKEAFKKLPLLKRFAITSYNDFEQFLLYAASVLKECTCIPTVRD